MIVIHFFRLQHLLDELDPVVIPIRIEGTVRTVASDTAGITLDHAEIHVRAVRGWDIRAFMVPVGKLQRLHGQPFGADPDAADKLDQRLRATERAIGECIADQGFTVRPGLIDMGGAEPVNGVWPGVINGDPAEALESVQNSAGAVADG